MDATRWREADRILRLSLELDEHQIEALLDTECGDDLELRATVESLLDHDRGEVEILDRPPFLSSPVTAPGDRVGPWRLGSLIGEGGSGAVYEAERLEGSFEGPVAIKLLHQHLCTSRARDRFYFESQVLARLDHPHIARLYDTGVSEHGVPYMVLERVEGTRLDRWIQQTRPSLDARLQLFEEICQAVAFAHRNLVVHRDLKPGNVLVDEAGQPKLLDFGIARVLPGQGEDLSRLTRTHQQPMTPQYASPEQLRGQDVTTASDVYSLGLVLYELLTSRLPYQMESLLGEEKHLLLNGDLLIQKPSLRARREAPGSLHPSEIRPDLDTIVLTALETDLERRYPTAQALAEEIARFRSGRPIRARSPSAGYLLRRFVDRNRLATVAAGLFFLVVAGFTAGLVGTTQRLRDQERRARAEAATAQETVEFLGGLFEGAEPAVHQGRELTARQLLDRGASTLGDREDQEPETRAALATAIGKAYLEISRFPEARSFLEEALALRRGASVPSPEKTAEVRLLLARLERRESHFVAAAEQAAAAAEDLADADRPLLLAAARFQLGQALIDRGQLEAGEAEVESARELIDDPRLDLGLAGQIACTLASADMTRSHWSEALAHLKPGLRWLHEAHGPIHPEIFDCRTLEAYLWGQLEGPLEERDLLLQILADQVSLYGEAHEQVAWTLTNLATHHVLYEQEGLAEEYYHRALRVHEQLGIEDHVRTAVLLSGLGLTQWRQGKKDLSLETFQRCLESSRRHFDPGSIDLAYPLMMYGTHLGLAGRCREAEPLLRDAWDAFRRIRPEKDFSRHQAMWAYGYSRWCQGHEDGRPLMQRALQVAAEEGWAERPGLAPEIRLWRAMEEEL